MLYWWFFILIWIIVILSFFNSYSLRVIYLILFIGIFFLNFFFLLNYNKSIFWYQIIFLFYYISSLQISYIIGLDGLSLLFMILCVFLLMYCLLSYWFLKYKVNLFIFSLIFALWLLFNVFSVLDFFCFYVFFEGIVIPMFFLIGIWGSRSRKIYASYQFFIYTLLGSVFLLLCFLSIYLHLGSSSFDWLQHAFFFSNRQVILWFFMFSGLAVKIPVIPVHIWLPEAHVEAPTPGSVILAGILLKLGGYAILRLLLGTFYVISFDLIPFIFTIALLGFTYGSMVAFSQIDIKKIIAYSSIAHMNFSLFGMFSFSILGLSGMCYLMFGHAITSGALFWGIGVLYDRYKTRLIFYYSSLVLFMPIFSILYFIFILSNFGFPGTFNFVGEFLILAGAFEFSQLIVLLSTFGMILSLVYSLFLYNRLFFGSLQNIFIRYYCDCSRLEFTFLSTLVIFIFIGGMFPQCIFQFLHNLLVSGQFIEI